MLLAKNGGPLLTAPRRLKWLEQRGNDAQPDASGCESELQCKDQYCSGTWNVRVTNEGNLHMVTQEIAESEH